MMDNRKYLFFLLFFLLTVAKVNAQRDHQDTTSAKSAVFAAENYFNKAIGQQSWLYNGPAYLSYYPNIEGTALFRDITKFNNGTIWHDGFKYEDILLRYDVYKDVMVSFLHDNSSLFSLASEKISDVYLIGRHFVYLKIDESQETANLRSGFYDLAYDGKLKVLVRTTKVILEYIDVVAKRSFLEKTSYFLLKDGVYHGVSSERDFLNVVKEQKAGLRKYLKENKIKFKDNPVQAMLLLAAYYDKLTN